MSAQTPKEVIGKRVELIKKYGEINTAKPNLPYELKATGATVSELENIIEPALFVEVVRQWVFNEHVNNNGSSDRIILSDELTRMAELVVESDKVFGWNPEFHNLTYSMFKSFVQVLLTPGEIESRVNTSMDY